MARNVVCSDDPGVKILLKNDSSPEATSGFSVVEVGTSLSDIVVESWLRLCQTLEAAVTVTVSRST